MATGSTRVTVRCPACGGPVEVVLQVTLRETDGETVEAVLSIDKASLRHRVDEHVAASRSTHVKPGG